MNNPYCDCCSEEIPATQANEVPILSVKKWIVCDACVQTVSQFSPDYIDVVQSLVVEANIDAFCFEDDPIRGPAYGKVADILSRAIADIKDITVISTRHDRRSRVKTRRPDLFSEEKA